MIVTHGLAEVQRLYERAVWLDGGKITMQGEPEAVIEAYVTADGGNEAPHAPDAAALSGVYRASPRPAAASDGRPASRALTAGGCPSRGVIACGDSSAPESNRGGGPGTRRSEVATIRRAATSSRLKTH